MAILDFSGTRLRTKIGFVEEDPPKEAIDALGIVAGYSFYRFDESHLANLGELATTEAVIFRQSPQKPTRVLRKLERYASELLWHDCRVFVEPVPALPGMNGPALRKFVINRLDTLKLPPSGLSPNEEKTLGNWFDRQDLPPLTPCVHVLQRPGNWNDVAVLLRSNPAGAPASAELKLEVIGSDGCTLELAPEQEIIVRRAFWNCASVQLVAMMNGLSGVGTFRAYAHLKMGAVASKWPYTYFVKIGDRAKIAREFSAYQANALENVPYHLGPRLRLDRCALGHTQGILVSDYVHGAEPLKECARHGRAISAIANLYNTTLWAWRNSATEEDTPLQNFFEDAFTTPIPDHRKLLIAAYGAAKSPEELKALFMARVSRPVLIGVVHGDLHATNVLVRNNDAIIIDFEKVGTRAPLLRDMASLESGLFVDGFVGDRRSGAELLESVRCLYEPSAFDRDDVPCHPSDGSTWFFECVRQIRMQARQIECERCQYALVLAAALARKACNPELFQDDTTVSARPKLTSENARALAYRLSELILIGLSSRGKNAK